MTTKETIKLANKAFDALEPLNNISWNSYREKLFKACVAEEKDHRGFMGSFRESHTSDTASVNDAARLFAVKRVAEYLNGERMPFGKDFLHIQPSCFVAAGLVDEYGDKIRAYWSEFDIKTLAELDYCVIVKVKEAA